MEQYHSSIKNHWYHEIQFRDGSAMPEPSVYDASRKYRFFLDLPTDAFKSCSWLSTTEQATSALLPDEIAPTRLQTLTLYDRLSTALTVAQVCAMQRLCNCYAARLSSQPGPDSSRLSNQRLAQITETARQLAISPTKITDNVRLQLQKVGLTLNDIVTFNQLVGFIGFQSRIIAIVQAFCQLPPSQIAAPTPFQDAPDEIFYLRQTRWQSDLSPEDPHYSISDITDELLIPPVPSLLKPLYPLLTLDPSSLKALSALTTSTWQTRTNNMTELVCLLTAKINGSVSCFIDAQQQWSGDVDLPDAIRAGEKALRAWSRTRPREQALIQAVEQLTRMPHQFHYGHLLPLFKQGITHKEAQVLLINSALFGWINRLKIGLGKTM